MALTYRAYDRANQQMIYNVKSDTEHTIIGRLEGSEQWVKRLKSELVFQRGSQQHDICLTPIYEDDVLRNELGHRFRVEYQKQSNTWMLFDMDKRMYSPFRNVSQYQVITHKYGLIVDLKISSGSPFPNPVELPVKIEEPQPEALLSFESRPTTRPSGNGNSMANGTKLTLAEAVEIPSFIVQRKREKKNYA